MKLLVAKKVNGKDVYYVIKNATRAVAFNSSGRATVEVTEDGEAIEPRNHKHPDFQKVPEYV